MRGMPPREKPWRGETSPLEQSAEEEWEEVLSELEDDWAADPPSPPSLHMDELPAASEEPDQPAAMLEEDCGCPGTAAAPSHPQPFSSPCTNEMEVQTPRKQSAECGTQTMLDTSTQAASLEQMEEVLAVIQRVQGEIENSRSFQRSLEKWLADLGAEVERLRLLGETIVEMLTKMSEMRQPEP